MTYFNALRAVGRPIGRLGFSGWQAYAFAVALIMVAGFVRWALPEQLGARVPFPTFFLAVFISAWVGGWRAGLLASVLTVLAGALIFPFNGDSPTWQDVLALIFVFSVCVFGTVVCAKLRASTDILDRDREWYERILDNVGDAVLVISSDGKLNYFNRHAARLWHLYPDHLGDDVVDVAPLWSEGDIEPFANLRILISRATERLDLPAGLEVRNGDRGIPITGNISRFRDPQYGEIAVLAVQSIQELHDAWGQLEASKRRLKTLFASDIIGLFNVDHRGHLFGINSAMLKMLGYDPGEAFEFPTQLHAIASDETLRCVHERMRQSTEEPVDCQLRQKDGSLHWVSLGIAAVSQDEWTVFVTDAHARKMVEKKLRESQQLLQIIIDQVPAFVSFVTPDGRNAVVNRFYKDYVGADVEHLLWMQGISADAHDFIAPYAAQAQAGKSAAFTMQALHSTGAQRHLQVHLVPYQTEELGLRGIVVYAYDITDSLERELCLKNSEARFRRLAEASSAVVWQACASGKLLEQLGWTRFTGLLPLSNFSEWITVVHPDDIEKMRQFVEALRTSTEGCETEVRFVHLSGEFRYVALRAVVLDGDKEGLAQWIGTIRDIHQRRQAEQALAKKESELRLILNAMPARIAYIDRNGLMQWANQSFTEWFDFQGEVKGRQLSTVITPDVMPLYYQPLRQAQNGCVSQFEWSKEHPIFGLRWTTTTLSPDIDDKGKVRGVIVLCIDSTERNETEEALRRSDAEHRTLIENVPHMVWMADANGKVDYFNNRWYEYTGTRVSEDWTESMHPSDRLRALAAFESAAKERSDLSVEVRYRRGIDSCYRWHLARAMPLRDTDGKIDRWYGTCTDIDDQKTAQDTLREAQTRSNHFLSTLSHELRNPLAALTASAHLLGHVGFGTSIWQDATRTIQRQTLHLKRLVDDLLDVSRITLGKIQLDQQIFDLRQVCKDACSDFGERAEARGVDLHCNVPDNPIYVRADAARIRQCVDNLVSNAVKASSENMEVLITASTDDNLAKVSVVDSGVGIPEDALETVFQPFTQSEDWRDKGLGLGLSIVHKMIELHGGSVAVESAGRHLGACFVLRLPLAVYKSEQELAKSEQEIDDAISGETSRSITGIVLIVDDELDNSRALQYLLELDGHRVYTAEDGAAALPLITQVQPEVVICDLGLPPPLSGYDVARRIRASSEKPIYLCAYSGYGTKEDIKRALAAGFDTHITKPSSPQSIIAEVRKGIEKIREPYSST